MEEVLRQAVETDAGREADYHPIQHPREQTESRRLEQPGAARCLVPRQSEGPVQARAAVLRAPNPTGQGRENRCGESQLLPAAGRTTTRLYARLRVCEREGQANGSQGVVYTVDALQPQHTASEVKNSQSGVAPHSTHQAIRCQARRPRQRAHQEHGPAHSDSEVGGGGPWTYPFGQLTRFSF